MSSSFEAGPSAAILIEGLRDFGYNLETALADVIDNSITAGANFIEVMVDLNGGNPRIAVLDNGSGMTPEELRVAMRPGSKSPRAHRGEKDLGRFGLGLKTASFSQCRQLTVVTRRNGTTSAAQWDLDHVARTDRWLVLIPEPVGGVPFSDRLGSTGTLVLWQTLDRLVDLEHPQSMSRELNLRVDSARRHLELVFHRFLEGEGRSNPPIRILLNGIDLKPFSPFATHCPATITGPPSKIGFAGGRITVQPYTLPHHSKVTAREWKELAGPEGYIKGQGFYLYRARRLIVSGTWFGLAPQSELTRLARVQLDMPNGMDEAWKVNVLKASAQPPVAVRRDLQVVVEQITGSAKRVYQQRGRRLAQANQVPIWARTASGGFITYEVNRSHPAFAQFRATLAQEGRDEFEGLLKLIGAALPIETLQVDLGDQPEAVRGAIADDETFARLVEETVRGLTASGVPRQDIEGMLKMSEPFRTRWDETTRLIQSTFAS